MLTFCLCYCIEGPYHRKGAATHTTDQDVATYTWQDVAKHNSAKSAWVIIRGVVYDVTGTIQLQIIDISCNRLVEEILILWAV